MSNQLSPFLQKISESFNLQQLIKITLGNKRDKSADLKNVFIKPVRIKNAEKLSFTYRNPTQDIFKNYDLKESLILIEKMLQADFYNADLFTAANDLHLAIDKNDVVKIITRPATLSITAATQQHDKQKVRVVNSTTAVYLHQLGITTAEGVVKKDMQDKFKQINRYVEIIEGIIKDIQLDENITVADMGSGKGYLTFALYDYLTNTLKKDATVVGIEMREDLVNKCNQIAKNIHYQNLKFEKGTIQDAAVPAINMLIALHACDTATDDAICKGIQANARVIICAPCCHKQIRKQMAPENELKNITKHGILLERQAEIVTDSIRALMLEAHGYKTKVFEFIATEHTPKNVLIVGIRTNTTEASKQENLEKVAGLKKLFNIKTHYLETLL
ncbi:class I SAM-dependent methyltransferase [Ferruginibacter profundus]